MSMTTPETAPVEVTQADIDAAVAYWRGWSNNIPVADGEYHPLVQAFARHRLIFRQDGLREALEALEMAAGWFRDYERQHRAKLTRDGNFKAETNGERANFLENVLAGLSDISPLANDTGALREAVEAFRALLATHDEDEGMDEFGDDESVGAQSDPDGSNIRDLPLTFGILRRARQAFAALSPDDGEGK